MLDQYSQNTYPQYHTLPRGKKWLRKSASIVAHAACRLGNAPKGTGAFANVFVYPDEWKSASMRASPPGEPDMS